MRDDDSRLGLIADIRTGNRRLAALAHPIYGEVVAAALPETRARRLKRRLADDLERVGARRRDDLLRLALWRLDGGGSATPSLYARAASRALASLDGALAERLARAALADRATDVGAMVLLGRAMASQHRVDEAEDAFVRTAGNARSGAEVANVALAQANLLYFQGGRPEEASAVLSAAAPRVRDRDWRDEIDSLLALFRAAAGDLPGVADAGRRLMRRPGARPRAVVHAPMYSSIANVMMGRFSEAEDHVAVGLRLAPATREELPLAGQMLEINRAMAAAYAGRHARSVELGRAGYRAALESGAPEVASMWG